MTEGKMIRIGKWLNTQGYDIDLDEWDWMEEHRWDEHKTKDIIQLIFDYSTKDKDNG